jgi:predicted SnoaL-like aldol condensation-catalyzing enzyme
MINIFRMKDATVIDRIFAESLIQHDPNLADGLAGMKSPATEIMSSAAADITIFRTLVDGDLALLHSRYEGLDTAPGPLLAFDLFRFTDDKIVEHWADNSRSRQLATFRSYPSGWSYDGGGAREDRSQPDASADLEGSHNPSPTLRSNRGIFGR